jgi:hypothetical protein
MSVHDFAKFKERKLNEQKQIEKEVKDKKQKKLSVDDVDTHEHVRFMKESFFTRFRIMKPPGILAIINQENLPDPFPPDFQPLPPMAA